MAMAEAAAEASPGASPTDTTKIVLELPTVGNKQAQANNAKVDGLEEKRPTEAVKRGANARLLTCLLGFFTMPCQLVDFLRGLFQDFRGYVPMAALQYGANQGIGMSVGAFAMRYYMMDVLGLDGATMGRYATASRLPWNVKPLFGLLSDAVPLFGYHRTSYLAIASGGGMLAYALLGTLPMAAIVTVPLMFLVNLSVAAPDVIIDASTAELSKDIPARASDLQSLSWGALSVGGLMACSLKGPFEEIIGPKGLLLACVACSASIFVPALLRCLPEKRLPRGQRWKCDTKLLFKHRGISMLAAFMSIAAVTLSVVQVLVESRSIRGGLTLLAGVALSVGVYATLKDITPILAKTALFIFLRQCFQPGLGETMTVWLTKAPEGPQFSPTMLGWIDCFGSLSLLVGITVYNKYLTNVSYRRIFLIAQLAMVVMNMSDYILVKRWNLAVGIPDVVFIVGDDAITLLMSRFFSMPLFVLASKVCPDNMEATLFAMLMSLSNFGSTISEFAGVSLLEAFGVVHRNFDMLPQAIVTKSLCRLLVIPLIFVLVPNLTPQDPIDLDEQDDAATGAAKQQGGEQEGEEEEKDAAQSPWQVEDPLSPLRSRGPSTPKAPVT